MDDSKFSKSVSRRGRLDVDDLTLLASSLVHGKESLDLYAGGFRRGGPQVMK
jgi:hypothetical protein